MAQENAVQPTSKRTGKAARSVLLLIVLGLAVHLLLPQITTLEHSLQVLKGMTWWAVALAAGAQVLSYLGSGVLLRAIAAITGDRLSVARGTLITAASYSVGLVGGGMVGGGAATYRWTRGSGLSAEGALLAGWLPAVVDDGVLLVVSVFGLLYLLVVHELTALQALSFGLIALMLSLLAAVIVWGTRHHPWLTNRATRLTRHWATLRRRPYDPAPTQASVDCLLDAWERLGGGGWRGPVLGATINTVFDMLTLYLVFIAAGHRVSLAVLLAGYGLPLLLGKAPLLPGGVGIVESTMAALYTSLGVPNAVAVVVILIYRFFSFWLPSLVGFPLVPMLQRMTDQAAPGPGAQ
ncbi:MAG: YbhN family protein [Anaerolineae bacterium]